MQATIIAIGPAVPDDVIVRCREVIAAGGVIGYPTDTYYALGVDPGNAAAVRRLFSIKGRQEDQPILLLVADRASVARWAAGTNDTAERLMERFWPGPLTLVFEARREVSKVLTGGSDTIGLRVPGNALTRMLLDALGTALTGTSANRTGDPAPTTAEAVRRTIGNEVDLILDGGPATVERPSTVVDVRRNVPVIIRQGAIDADHLL